VQCSYDPSNRPVKSVTQTSTNDPVTTFRCAGTSASASSTAPVMPLTPTAQVELERVSWLHLYTLGY
jgi:hypothetical protein